MLRSLRHYLRTQSHHMDEMKYRRRKRLMIFLERTIKGHRESNQYCFIRLTSTVSKATPEKLLGDGTERLQAFPSAEKNTLNSN